jgi:serine/threonine protein kinase
MKLQRLLSQDQILWDHLHAPDIEQFYEHQKTPWAQGGSSDVFLLSDNKLCKREKLYTAPSPYNNDSFYQKGHKMFYIKESFILEALIMDTLHPISPLIPKVYNYKFGQLKNGTWVSVVIMEKIDGDNYPPTPFNMDVMKGLWVPFFKNLNKLYHGYSFIHGDLIFRNMKIQHGKLVLIDFGLSSMMINNIFFCRYHSFKRCIEQFLNDKIMITRMNETIPKRDCHDIIRFVQEHRQGVDVCALLGRFMNKLPSPIVEILSSCIGGRTSKLQQTTMAHQPFPMSYSREVITYDRIIALLN